VATAENSSARETSQQYTVLTQPAGGDLACSGDRDLVFRPVCQNSSIRSPLAQLRCVEKASDFSE
jgi:hypothetical protein